MLITRPIPADLYDTLKGIETDSANVQTFAQDAQTTANNAQGTANTALTKANAAQTSANNAQTSANNAQTSANTADSKAVAAYVTAANATGRLAGDNDYFEGTGTFTGTPSNFIVTSITPVSAVGINYTAGYFTFSYHGNYLVVITQKGDCNNTRTDWYQEISIHLKEFVSSAVVPVTFKSIPPSGTWNMENTGSNIINIKAGNQWKVVINMIANGSTTNGTFNIKIKKVT